MKRKVSSISLAAILVLQLGIFYTSEASREAKYSVGSKDIILKGVGGTGDDYLDSVSYTTDGGAIAVGYSNSTDNDIVSNGGYDGIITKYSSTGKVQWSKSWGGSASDKFHAVTQVKDGNYIAVGESSSTGLGFSNNGDADSVIVKFDKNGSVLWSKNWGGNQFDSFTSILELSNGDLVAIGTYTSTNLSHPNKGMVDSVLIKFDKNGNIKKSEAFGGNGEDTLTSIIELKNGDLAVVGYSYSYDLPIPDMANTDGLALIYDKELNLKVAKKLGGGEEDYLFSATPTADGGFIAVGESDTSSAGLGVSHKGMTDAIVVKYDASANVQWVKSYGGSGHDAFHSIIETTENKFMAVGRSDSTNAGVSNKGHNDSILVQYDKNGNKEWEASFGGSYNDYLNSVTKTIDGGFVSVGFSHSGDIGVDHKGASDGIIIAYSPVAYAIGDLVEKDSGDVNLGELGGSMDQIEKLPESEAKDELENQVLALIDAKIDAAQTSMEISEVRSLVNNLSESVKKNYLMDKVNNKVPTDIGGIDQKSATSNIDVYIKSENMLSLSVDTNVINFDNFSGVADDEKLNALTLSVNSSLPYEVNSYLASEIQNADKTKTMDKSILNIRANGTADYKTFSSINTKLMLLDNQVAGNNKTHGIDLKLKSGLAYEKDNYKATLKFEIVQK